jgi:hypothetical protein
LFAVSGVGFVLPPRLLLSGWVHRALEAQPGPSGDLVDARTCGRVVDALADRMPIGGRCLQRSLVLGWMLRRRGIGSRLRIGVQKIEGVLSAHAWLEVAGEPVNDTPNHCGAYVVFDAPEERLVALMKLERAS